MFLNRGVEEPQLFTLCKLLLLECSCEVEFVHKCQRGVRFCRLLRWIMSLAVKAITVARLKHTFPIVPHILNEMMGVQNLYFSRI